MNKPTHATTTIPLEDDTTKYASVRAGAGSSPALRVACPVCKVDVGKYCQKNGGIDVQVIAHKKRRELAAATRFDETFGK